MKRSTGPGGGEPSRRPARKCRQRLPAADQASRWGARNGCSAPGQSLVSRYPTQATCSQVVADAVVGSQLRDSRRHRPSWAKQSSTFRSGRMGLKPLGLFGLRQPHMFVSPPGGYQICVALWSIGARLTNRMGSGVSDVTNGMGSGLVSSPPVAPLDAEASS